VFLRQNYVRITYAPNLRSLPFSFSIRVLGIQIDTKLKWNAHIAKIHDRYASQSLALGRITASTWGASFEKARLVYSATVTPAITYGAGIWHSPQGTETARKFIGKQLETLQNQGLRRILGAYKAVNSAVLEKEADIPPIEATLSKAVANSLKRRYQTKGGQEITKACEDIRNHNPGGTRAQRKMRQITPHEAKTKWLRKNIPEDTWNREILQRPTTGHDTSKPMPWNKAIAKITKTSWDKKWTAYLNAIPADRAKSPAQLDTRRKRSQLHAGLSKPMSSLITQIRTEKNRPQCLPGRQTRTRIYIYVLLRMATADCEAYTNELHRLCGTATKPV
jgi:hypothetical protein